MKQPIKYAKKELVKYGAEIISESEHRVIFAMPQGGKYTVTRTSTLPRIREVVQEAYFAAVGLRGFSAIAPMHLPYAQLRMSDHFLERLDLMHKQDDVTMLEVLETIAHPIQVYAKQNRLQIAVRGERVTVLAIYTEDDVLLKTLLWSTPALWARNPRTEDE